MQYIGAAPDGDSPGSREWRLLPEGAGRVVVRIGKLLREDSLPAEIVHTLGAVSALAPRSTVPGGRLIGLWIWAWLSTSGTGGPGMRVNV